jgi:SAM-dependent methyltransferase
MIADLALKMKRTMIGRLLKRFKGRAARMKARGVLVSKVLSEPELFAQVLSHDPYVWRVLADRYWLEGALERKDEVESFLSRQKADEPLRAFRQEFDRFMELAGSAPRLPMRTVDISPQLSDRATITPIDRHYTYHPAWAARVLAKTLPSKHVDISSIVNFCTIVSAFVPVDFYDFRPAPIELDGLYTGAADLTQLHFPDDSIASLSCMHVIEHIGLGRYGDPLDPDGDLKAISELVRVVAPGGDLLVATPVGQPRVAFNAHRVYDYETFARYFLPLELVEFTLIEEHGVGGLVVAPSLERVRAEYYACGCFWFRKPKAEKGAQAKASDLGTASR